MAVFRFLNDLDNLILSIAGGSSNALAELYCETSAGVYAYALSILKNAQDAEDVLQECYIKIYASASQYKPQGKPMAWILTIARNLCFKLLEQKKNVSQLSFDYAAQRWEPDDKLIIDTCLQQLSSEDRQIVILHAVAGMKHREIAKFLSLPLSTVLSKYNRAIKKMRSCI